MEKVKTFGERYLEQQEQQCYNTDPQMSAQSCGCDPGYRAQNSIELGHYCSRYPSCAYGKSVGVRMLTSDKAMPEYPEKLTKLKGIEDSGKRVTYSSGAMRDPGEGKLKWSRIFFGPMARRWAQHLTTAEAKYPDAAPGVPNFTLIHTLEEKLRYKESALRHFMSWYHDETNEDHASAVFFNINGVEIIKAKERGDLIDGITYSPVTPSYKLAQPGPYSGDYNVAPNDCVERTD